MLTMLAADAAPDCFLVMQPDLAGWASSNVLLTLDPYIRRDAKEVNVDDFFATHVAAGKWQGKQVTLTPDGCAILEYYNVTLFQEAGVAAPKATWTWNEYLDAARKLTKKDGNGKVVQAGACARSGSGEGSSKPAQLRTGVTLRVMRTIDAGEIPSGSTRVITRFQQLHPGVTRWGTIANNGLAVPALLERRGVPDRGQQELRAGLRSGHRRPAVHAGPEPQIQGRPAARPDAQQSPRYVWQRPGGQPCHWHRTGWEYRADVKSFQWDVAPVPKGKAERGTIYTGAACFLAKETKNLEEAWALPQHITSKEVLGGGTTLEMLARKSVVASDRFLSPGQAPERMRVFTDAGNFAKAYPQITNWPDVSNVIGKELDPLWKGERSARETAQRIVQVVNVLLQEAGFGAR